MILTVPDELIEEARSKMMTFSKEEKATFIPIFLNSLFSINKFGRKITLELLRED